ncbi:MAG: flavin reductase family protein [Gemmatimonadota bacterium]|nr:MAG: flavin reductase family protein [Gemmatimonadota bacterium]
MITTRASDGRPQGLTATAICSVSLDPPLVLACLSGHSSTHEAIEASGVFAVSFLGVEDTAIADRFAGDAVDKFEGVPRRAGITGAPVVQAGLAYCDCVVVQQVEAGDHTIFIGRVDAAGAFGESGDPPRPLVRFRGAYRTAGALADEPGGAAQEKRGPG